MKKFFKILFTYLLILLPWFLSSLFFRGNSFYQTLNLPFFALPSFAYGIVWTILYILIAISIYIVYSKNSISRIKSYNIALFLNYLFNQLYTFLLFGLENLFISFIDSILILITAINLYDETKKLNNKASKFLIPYVLFSVFACILSLTVYFMNL